MNRATNYVVDASVLVAYLHLNDPSHRDADALFLELVSAQASVFVPAIAFPEVAAAISRGQDDTDRALESVLFRTRFEGLRIVVVDEALSQLATEVAAKQRIRGCDAVYVALSMTLDVPLITLDHQQKERTPNVVTALTPGEALGSVWDQ